MTFELSDSLPSPEFLTISSKPLSPISYTFFPEATLGKSHPQHLIILLNGLGLPSASWLPSIEIFQSERASGSLPAILTYDRFGQGLTTSRDPVDSQKPRGHDFQDVVSDLDEIILTICKSKLDLQAHEVEASTLRLIIVGASIGANIARLYAQNHPGLVEGLILLDSNMANTDYSAFWPDPDSPDFSPSSVVADDCTLEQYIVTRAKVCGMFDLDVKNPEGLDRSTGAVLLPRADGPRLIGAGGKGPELKVIGHDPETFAEMSLKMMGAPKSTTERFVQKYWEKYNEHLTKITDEGKCDGVTIANGCGHFIQKDDPSFVANEIVGMMEKLGW